MPAISEITTSPPRPDFLPMRPLREGRTTLPRDDKRAHLRGLRLHRTPTHRPRTPAFRPRPRPPGWVHGPSHTPVYHRLQSPGRRPRPPERRSQRRGIHPDLVREDHHIHEARLPRHRGRSPGDRPRLVPGQGLVNDQLAGGGGSAGRRHGPGLGGADHRGYADAPPGTAAPEGDRGPGHPRRGPRMAHPNSP